MKKIKQFVHTHLFFSCFMIPFLMQSFILLIGLLAGGFTFASNDCYYQYVPFFTSLLNKLKDGSSFFYTTISGMGFDYYTFACYYLFSPFNLLILLFKEDQILIFINFLILLKVSCCSLSMAYYLKKSHKLPESAILIGSLCYALSGYVLGYQFNIMWLDGIYLFPLIMLSMNDLLYKKRKTSYILFLSLAILSNYMIGYMICLFLFFYYFTCNFHSIKDFFMKGIRFALSSLTAVCISCIVLIPSYLSLSEMKVVKGNIPTFSWIGSFYDELSSFLFLKAPNGITFDSEKVNLYCTIFILILFVSYFLSKRISWKNKLKKIILVLFLFVSFNQEFLNFIWHGFHKQSGIPNRFSFMLIFLIITSVAELIEKGRLSNKQTIFSGIIVSCFILFISYKTDLIPIICISSLFLTILYVFVLIKRKKLPILIVSLEIFIMACLTFCNTGGKTAYGVYELKDDYATIKSQGYHRIKIQDLDETEEKALNKRIDKLELKDFFDLDKLLVLRNDLKEYGMRNSINESFIYNVPAISMFNTFCNQNLSSFYVKTGNTGSSNTLKMFGDNSVVDMLMGIQATVVKKQETDSLIYQTDFETEHLRIDKNHYALPLGYLIENNVTMNDLSQSNPFENLNTIIKKIANETLYTIIPGTFLNAECTVTSKTNHSFSYETEKASTVSYQFSLTDSNVLYFYYNCSNCSKVDITQNGDMIQTLTLDKRIHKLEFSDKSNPVQITFHLKSKKDGTCRFYLSKLDEDAFYRSYATLSRVPLEINQFEDGEVNGTITLETDGKLLITIPILNGWTIYVDDKKSEFDTFCNSFYVLNLTEGTHSIRLSYQTPGFKIGGLLSSLGIFIFCLIFYYEYKPLKKKESI